MSRLDLPRRRLSAISKAVRCFRSPGTDVLGTGAWTKMTTDVQKDGRFAPANLSTVGSFTSACSEPQPFVPGFREPLGTPFKEVLVPIRLKQVAGILAEELHPGVLAPVVRVEPLHRLCRR